MCFVYLHALQTRHDLYVINHITGKTLDALQAQDVMRIGWAVHNHFALVHHLTVVDQNLLFLGNQELVAYAFQVGNDQTLLALGVLTERYRAGNVGQRSEEHTSELQSLMRISYAVFCLKKKNYSL